MTKFNKSNFYYINKEIEHFTYTFTGPMGDKGKRGNIVYSLVKFNDRPKPIPIDWWVIKNKVGINKVFDMRISGIWMAQEQRSTFTSFLSNNNGDINKLINRLNSESR